ncbi:MAG: hypothetical protein H0U73_12695 [Tatlockia sp.]|nr:hypothetical protein [Tatlockia sp.]
MTRKLVDVHLIQLHINKAIDRLPQEDISKIGLHPLSRSDLQLQKSFALLHSPLKKPKWFEGYQDCIDHLIMEIDGLVAQIKTENAKEAKKRTLVSALIAAKMLIQHGLDYLAHQAEAKQIEYMSDVIQLQKKVEEGLDVFFPEREKIFHLNLRELRTDYERAYSVNFGKGFLGFFTLPARLYFRQNSRIPVLEFLEKVDQCLIIYDQVYTPETKRLIKLTALNLIRFTIQAEFYGYNSLLLRLVNERLTEAGFPNSPVIMGNFSKFCSSHRIHMPVEINDFYQECVSPRF